MKDNEKKLIKILLIITVIMFIIFLISRTGKSKTKVEVNEDVVKEIGIDVNDEAYKGKTIYEQDGDIIIENEDGSKTIETRKKENDTDLKEITEDEKSKYEITNVNVTVNGSRTSISGKVKNTTKEKHKVVVSAKFYSNENKAKGSGNAVMEELKVGETQDFEIVIMGNMTGYTHQVNVEFTD